MEDLNADAALAADLVREAGTLAAQMRAGGLRAEQKTATADVVTAADRAAERLITDHLAAFRPDDGVLGEEGASRPGTSGRTWVIDPVDGTYNFVHGLDWWCSALALVEGDPDGVGSGGGQVLLGAVHHPAAGLVYVGGPRLHPQCNGEPMEPLLDRPLGESCLTTYLHPPFYGDEVGAAFARMAGGAATLRMLGSGTLDAMAIASGRLHMSCQHSVPAWDRLPGLGIITGVGGTARQIRAAGVTWSLAGAPTAVAEACRRLTGR